MLCLTFLPEVSQRTVQQVPAVKRRIYDGELTQRSNR